MSQKSMIEQVVREHEFNFITSANPEQILAVAQAAAPVAAAGKAKGVIRVGSIVCNLTATSVSGTSLDTSWQFVHKAPLGSASICSFDITARPAQDGRFQVSLEIGQYMWQKGSMFAKPTLNASFHLRQLEAFMRQELVK